MLSKGSLLLLAFSFLLIYASIVPVSGFVAANPGPVITLTPNSGPDGTPVTISGSNFGGGFLFYSCKISSTPIAIIGAPSCTVNTGKVSGGFTVASNGQPGVYTVTVTATTTVFASAPFTVTATQGVTTSTQPVPDFTIYVSPPSQSVLQGQTASYSVNVAALNGFNSQVSLSVSGLPSGANGFFSNPSGTPNFASTLTVTLPSDVSTSTYTLTVTGSGGGLTHVANLALTVNAATVTQTSQPTGATDLPILVGIVLLVAVLIWVALRRRRKPTPAQPTKTGVTTGKNNTAFCPGCGGRLPRHYSPCPINESKKRSLK